MVPELTYRKVVFYDAPVGKLVLIVSQFFLGRLSWVTGPVLYKNGTGISFEGKRVRACKKVTESLGFLLLPLP